MAIKTEGSTILDEKGYHNYPDKNVTKKELCEKWFPMSQATLSRRLKESESVKEYRDIQINLGGKVLVNVRGFYEFLSYRQKNRFRL